MKPLLIIRRQKSADNFACQDVVKDYIMSFAGESFLSCLFREITLQLIVLVWAIMFIFFGMPLFVCLWAIPIVILIILICVYVSHFTKAAEMANISTNNNQQCWVAEAYIPHFIRCTLKELDFNVITSGDLLATVETSEDRHRYRRIIIGTVSTKIHNAIDNSNWIYRFAVNPKYSLDKVGDPLIRQVLQSSFENNFFSVETNTSECQCELRELLLRIGFGLRQIYHKRIFGNMIRIMCSQLGVDLNTWINSAATN